MPPGSHRIGPWWSAKPRSPPAACPVEHLRLVVELSGHPELGPLLKEQSGRIEKMIQQGQMLRAGAQEGEAAQQQ